MSVTAAGGFVAAGVAAGIKDGGALDLALVVTDDGQPVPAAAVFTRNKMTAAPVTVSRSHLQSTTGRAAAVVINSGNANAGTGEPGIADAEMMCSLVAAGIGQHPQHVLVCSTGLIGYPLPMDAIEPGIAAALAARSAEGATDAAEAMRTTDTVRKEALITAEGLAGGGFTVGGMAKGAAMLAPDMATMLAVVTTDAAAGPAQLHRLLYEAVEASFNIMSVDGCTSTNDTVIVLASGRAGPVDPAALGAGLSEVCLSLATQMVGDAEGATKVVRLTVTGASTDAEAAAAARKVAESQLVKCSWYGQDPYWGRIASELGSAGVHFDARLVEIAYGGELVARAGVEIDHDRAAVAAHLAGRHLDVTCHLGLGPGRSTVLTNDLTHAYIDENMGTS